MSEMVTVMVVSEELPARSYALTFRVWTPDSPTVFQLMLYGADGAVPMGVEPSQKDTSRSPYVSEALAVTVTVPLIVAPFAGALKATVGLVRSTITPAFIDVWL